MKYAIIGAGIGGLTTALAFEKKGIDFHVYEQAPQLNEVGAGIWLAPNALKVLDSLGVLEKVQHQGNEIDRITIGKPNLEPLSDSKQDFIKSIFGYTTVSIHRANLQQLLFNHIPKEKLSLNKGFDSYEELNSGKIKINFEDNTSIESDFLIGADGINSKVRTQLFPTSKKRYSGQTCWRGITEIDMEEKYQHRGYELWGNQIRFGISQVTKGKVYWFAVKLAEENSKDNRAITKKELLELFSEFHPLVLKLIEETPLDKIIKSDINDLQPLDKWYQNNICLLGDAGHATTPNMGQGGAQAIEDAYYLSNAIVERNHINAFELFQQRREKKVQAIVKQSWNTGKMAHWKYGQSFRNFVIQHLPKSIIEKKMIALYQLE